MARFAGSLGERAARTASVACGPLAMLGLWRNPTRLVVVRRGKPLFFCETARGSYFASVPYALPGRGLSIVENYAGVVVFERGGLRLDARQIEPMDEV